LKASEPRLAPVIEKLLNVPGIQRVRLSSYAVVDFEEELLPLWKSHSGFCANLHLPLQSGDQGILKAMRRPYTLEAYRNLVNKIKEEIPSLGLTADIIAGFPGETDEAFQNTFDRIKEFNFIDFHPFPYSDRPQTPGESLFPKVNPAIIRDRMNQLWHLKKDCLEISAKKAQGKRFRVIVERYNAAQQAGLTDEGLRVVFDQKSGWLGKELAIQVEGFRDGHAWASVSNDFEKRA
jgi:threonylcarbamoyladenosine tRNA methylthiotransferase MtaB